MATSAYANLLYMLTPLFGWLASQKSRSSANALSGGRLMPSIQTDVSCMRGRGPEGSNLLVIFNGGRRSRCCPDLARFRGVVRPLEDGERHRAIHGGRKYSS